MKSDIPSANTNNIITHVSLICYATVLLATATNYVLYIFFLDFIFIMEDNGQWKRHEFFHDVALYHGITDA